MVAARLTERDVQILRFINDFGFCEIKHIEKQFQFKKPRSYQVMKRLIAMDLVNHEQIFHGRHGIYRLTKKGAGFTDLPPLNRLPLDYYYHEVKLVDLYLTLMAQYPGSDWRSERHLQQEKCQNGFGQFAHVADGLLTLPDGKKIAIELELSLKGRTRIERILKGYATQFHLDEIWYFCTRRVHAALSELIVKMPFIKLHLVEDLPNGK